MFEIEPPEEKSDIESRINNILIDAYDEYERAMSWYYYFEDELPFPFQAKTIAHRSISPLSIDEIVTVTGMAPSEECEHEIFISILWQNRPLAVPLRQLKPININKEASQALNDWQFWLTWI